MTVISGSLASVCRSRGERRGGGGGVKRKNSESERLKKDGEGSHTCVRPVLGWTWRRADRVLNSAVLSPVNTQVLSFLVTIMMQSYADC